LAFDAAIAPSLRGGERGAPLQLRLDVFSPWAIVSARTALAALVLVPLVFHRDLLQSLRGRLGPVVVLSFVQVAVPFSLIALGEEHISSSLAGILVASAPIFTFLLAFAFTGEQRANTAGLVGVAIGIVGVAMLLGVDTAGAPTPCSAVSWS
jgi:drug/metabolite transporter (DMT)-like permease